MAEKKLNSPGGISRLFRMQMFIPIVALIILAVFNLILDPGFFSITMGTNSAGDPVLSGYLITILDNGSEVAILAIGMTLVTAACGGQDISVECYHGYCRFRNPADPGGRRRRRAPGPHYRSFPGSMYCIYAVWRFQRRAGFNL